MEKKMSERERDAGRREKQSWQWVVFPDISTLVLSVPGTMCRMFCSLFRCNFANPSCAAMFFLLRRGFLQAPLPNKTCLFSLFLTVLQWTFKFNTLTNTCGVYCSWVFAVSLRSLTLEWICLDVNSWEDFYFKKCYQFSLRRLSVP